MAVNNDLSGAGRSGGSVNKRVLSILGHIVRIMFFRHPGALR
ncbi:hypothetical protein [Paenibacillus silvisoli]|nr:hypothetical protein [Paenibacillus silvisoli]